MRFEPRQYQSDCIEAWYKDILRPGCNPLVAAPTGSGKSVILGGLIEKYIQDHPHDRVLVLSHTEEIVEQDTDALKEFFPNKPIGVYHAGLGSKEIEQITVAGIQSAYRSPEKFIWTNLVIVDEAHAVNHKKAGMYRKLFKDMHATIAGMSATIFRSGHGYIHQGKTALFNQLSYDLTSLDNFNMLVEQGYLCNLVSVETLIQLDSKDVKKTAGEYNLKELAAKHDQEEITRAAVLEALHYGAKYQKWLVFAIDIEHCEHIAAELNAEGISARVLHSRMDADRKATIADFKAGKFRALVSVGMVTTGFDVQDIDLILMLRPTMSAVLHVQMIGRGLRIHPNKNHCLILDYAGNTARLGPVNNVTIPKAKGKGGPGVAPTKTCPECRTIMAASARHCTSCGHEFVFETKLEASASTAAVIERGLPENRIKWLKVDKVSYAIHEKHGAPDSLLVKYVCGLQVIKEWVCVQHGGYAGYKAKHWLDFRNYKGPLYTQEVYKNSSKLQQPTYIQVDMAPKYPSILNSRFD